jgi:hypothetical protein
MYQETVNHERYNVYALTSRHAEHNLYLEAATHDIYKGLAWASRQDLSNAFT